MSIGDTVFIFFLALIFFGPKKLPELARQLGKLVAEFRRASNEFRFQMEEELRMAEQADSQKRVDALKAAEPGDTTAIAAGTELSIMPPATGLPVGAGSEGGYGPGYGMELGDTETESGETAAEAGETEAEVGEAEVGAAETAPQSEAQPSHTEPPEGQDMSQMSPNLGPPSQLDAVEMPRSAEASGSEGADVAPDFAPDFHLDQNSSSHDRYALSKQRHASSNEKETNSADADVRETGADVRETGMPHEVHTANG